MSIARFLSAVSLVVFSSFGLIACDSQVDPTYEGDPMATIQGTIEGSGASTPSAVDAAIFWINFAQNGDTAATDSVPVTGSFPANFKLDLNAPPQPAMLNDFTHDGKYPNEGKFGIGFVVGLKAGSKDIGPDAENLVGMAEDHMVTYVSEDIKPGTDSAKFLGSALPAGYHLLQVVRSNDPDALYDTLTVAPQGFNTPVVITLGTEEMLDAPEVF